MSSKKEVKQETKVEPWGPFQDPIKWIGLDYVDRIKNGQPAYYPGSTIADQSDATKQANNMLLNYANSNNGLLQNATNTANNVMQNGGANQQSNGVISQLMNGLNLGNDPSMAGLQSLIGGAANNNTQGNNVLSQIMGANNLGLNATQNAMNNMGTNPTSQNLAGIAAGNNVGKNPYLDQMVSNQQDQIANKLKNTVLPGMQSQAASLGRSGSGAFASQVNNAQQTAANEMGKVATDMYANQYNNDVNTMMSANNQLSNNYNTGVANSLNAAGQLGQQQLAGNDQRMNAANANTASNNSMTALLGQLLGQQSSTYNQGVANQLNNSQLQLGAANAGSANSQNAANTSMNAANQAGNIWQNGLLPGQVAGSVGQGQDERAQDELNAKIQEWDFSQQMPLQQLANAMSVLTGGGYNQTTGVTTQKGSALGGLLGGLTSGLGLMSKLPGLCDKRLKENIKYLGDSPTGIKMYSFNYIDDDKTWIGPMAQEVQETNPELVGSLEDGTLFVMGGVFEEAA